MTLLLGVNPPKMSERSSIGPQRSRACCIRTRSKMVRSRGRY